MRALRTLSLLSLLFVATLAPVVHAQGISRQVARAQMIERTIREAAEQLANERKEYERAVEMLRHLRAADKALADTMQPNAAVLKAVEEIGEAKRFVDDFTVRQGIVRIERDFESAQRSPMSADFGHLRSVLRENGIGPAIRVVARNALRIEEETLAWLKVQELILTHVRGLTEIAGDGLRAAEQ